MSGRYRRNNYYRNRYRRNYYRNRRNNTYTRRSYGQMRAARQQADQASFVINVPTQASCFCKKANLNDYALNTHSVEIGTYAMNIYDILRKSEFYQSYATMYDEFKIDNIKVKLIPTKYNVTVNGNNTSGYQSFTVYTAWDRTGLNNKQMLLLTSGVYNNDPIDQSEPSILNREYIGKGLDNDGIYCIIGSDITTYSSAESRQVSTGQNSSITRYLRPKTLQEKSQWISTTQLKTWYYKYNDDIAAFQMIPTAKADDYPSIFNGIDLVNKSITTNLASISPAVSNNPCFLEEDPSINFKPTLLIGVYPADDANVTLGDTRKITFNVESEISCTFRGLRKSRVV